jgi:hypothetical protein
MAHEIFQGCVVGVRQVIDSFVKPDVPQTIILDLCSTRPVTQIVVTRRREGGGGGGGGKSTPQLPLKSLGAVASLEAALVAL